MKNLFKILASIVCGIAQSLMFGLVLSKLWDWFIVTAFTSAPHLGYLQAVGLGMVASLLLTNVHIAILGRQPKDEIQDSVTGGLVRSLIVTCFFYPLVLLSGFVWSQFL